VAGEPVVMVIGNVADDPYSTVVADGVMVAVALLIEKDPGLYVME